jgi:allophanate hydrolase subunit 1
LCSANNDKGSGTVRGMSPQAWYDIDRAVPLTRWLGDYIRFRSSELSRRVSRVLTIG